MKKITVTSVLDAPPEAVWKKLLDLETRSMKTSYLVKLHEIEAGLSVLDNMSCDTIEEANNCVIKYEEYKDKIILVIRQLMYCSSMSVTDKELVYNEAVRIVADRIGSADDAQKYGEVMETLRNENKLTEQQLRLFYDSINTGRWR